MKKISIYILLFMGVALASCNNNTYSNALKEEQKLIENFIARQGIQVVTEKPTEWGDKVYWKVPDKDNYYFHLVEVGDTTKPALEAKDKAHRTAIHGIYRIHMRRLANRFGTHAIHWCSV